MFNVWGGVHKGSNKEDVTKIKIFKVEVVSKLVPKKRKNQFTKVKSVARYLHNSDFL